MIRRRRMRLLEKTAPCANCWPPRSRAVAPSARRGPAPGVVDQRAGRRAGALAQPAWPRRRPHHRQARGLGHADRVYTLAITALVLLVVLEHASAPARRPPARAAAAVACSPYRVWDRSMPMPPRKNPATHRARVGPAHVPPRHPAPRLKRLAAYRHAGDWHPSTATPASPVPAPVPTLRITEIPAEPRGSWLDALKAELQRCGIEFLRPAGLRLPRACNTANPTKDGVPSRNARP